MKFNVQLLHTAPLNEHMPIGIFSVCAPKLSGCILFATHGSCAIFLNNDFQYNSTCSVTGGCITYWRGHKRKISVNRSSNELRIRFFFHFKQSSPEGFQPLEFFTSRFRGLQIVCTHYAWRKRHTRRDPKMVQKSKTSNQKKHQEKKRAVCLQKRFSCFYAVIGFIGFPQITSDLTSKMVIVVLARDCNYSMWV